MERDPLDRDYTPRSLAAACVRIVAADWLAHAGQAPRLVVEPSVGGGAFAAPICAAWPIARVVGVDLDFRAKGLREPGVEGIVGDFLRIGRSAFHTRTSMDAPDVVVGNPPFSSAEAFVRHALDLAAPGGMVALILRLGFLESGDRVAFWRSCPGWRLRAFAERPSFRGDSETGHGKTDGTAYGLFSWVKGYSGQMIAEPGVSWRGGK